MNSLNQQAYLADFAPKQSLDKYAKGADPRVISGIVALSEMQQQAAMRQQANLASGAAQGQMPTVRDKIMQMFQQANQPRQQPQQQPTPMQQGIMAQAHPQMQTAPMPQEEAPEEAQMYHGGVAHLPVNDRMFGYANGGIITFDGETGSDVPAADSREAEIRKRNARNTLPETTGYEGQGIGEFLSNILGAVAEKFKGSEARTLAAQRAEAMQRENAKKEAALGPLMQDYVPRRSEDQQRDADAVARGAVPVPAPAPAPALARPPAAAPAPARPPAAAPSGNATVNPNATAAGTGIDALLAQQANRLAAQRTPVGPQLPEPDMAANTLKLLEAQEKYVRENPNSPAADKLLQYYDDMRRRAIADDNAEAAQRVADKEQNLWSFLSNIRGGTLASAAQRANADLSARQSEQKTAAAAYRKYSYERDLNLNKAAAEVRLAEEERKRNRFDKALVHEEAARSYRLEAKKAEDTAQHYRDTASNQLLGTIATRESAREGHLTQLQVANIYAAAQRAGFNKPSEAERVREEYNRIRTEKGQKAADEFLSDETKIRAAVGGAKYEGPDKSVQNRAKVYEILNKNESYTTAQETIRRLEAKAKRTPQEEQRLAQARKYTQDTFNNTYKGIYGTGPDADTGSSGGFPVTAPDGNTYNFKTQAEADAFRAKIGG